MSCWFSVDAFPIENSQEKRPVPPKGSTPWFDAPAAAVAATAAAADRKGASQGTHGDEGGGGSGGDVEAPRITPDQRSDPLNWTTRMAASLPGWAKDGQGDGAAAVRPPRAPPNLSHLPTDMNATIRSDLNLSMPAAAPRNLDSAAGGAESQPQLADQIRRDGRSVCVYV